MSQHRARDIASGWGIPPTDGLWLLHLGDCCHLQTPGPSVSVNLSELSEGKVIPVFMGFDCTLCLPLGGVTPLKSQLG